MRKYNHYIVSFSSIILLILFLQGCKKIAEPDKASAGFVISKIDINGKVLQSSTSDVVTIVMDTINKYVERTLPDGTKYATVEKGFGVKVRLEISGNGYNKSIWTGDSLHVYDAYVSEVATIESKLISTKKDSTISAINSGFSVNSKGYIDYDQYQKPGEYKITVISSNWSEMNESKSSRDVKTKILKLVKP